MFAKLFSSKPNQSTDNSAELSDCEKLQRADAIFRRKCKPFGNLSALNGREPSEMNVEERECVESLGKAIDLLDACLEEKVRISMQRSKMGASR